MWKCRSIMMSFSRWASNMHASPPPIFPYLFNAVKCPFQEVFTEMEEKYGEVEEMNVCDNLGDHLVGNVYVKVRDRPSLFLWFFSLHTSCPYIHCRAQITQLHSPQLCNYVTKAISTLMFLNKNDLSVRFISEIIYVDSKMPANAYHVTVHVHWTCACWYINRKLIVYSGAGCLVVDRSNNSLPSAHVGSCSVIKCRN